MLIIPAGSPPPERISLSTVKYRIRIYFIALQAFCSTKIIFQFPFQSVSIWTHKNNGELSLPAMYAHFAILLQSLSELCDLCELFFSIASSCADCADAHILKSCVSCHCLVCSPFWQFRGQNAKATRIRPGMRPGNTLRGCPGGC